MKDKGFTPIELFIVVAIIGILVTVVVASLVDAREKARIQKAIIEMNQIVKAITIAQGESEDYLMIITESSCSDCVGGRIVGFNYRNVPETNAFYTRWALFILNIENATNGLMIGVSKITRDPWGSPYDLDENEGERGGCSFDNLRSYGPDGLYGTFDDIMSGQIPKIKCP